MTATQRWFLSLVVTVLAVAASYLWLDRSIALLVHVRLPRHEAFALLTHIPDPFVCVYRKLDSTILVVKATENWVRRDGTEALNRAMERRVFVQGTMSPRLIIVGGICP